MKVTSNQCLAWSMVWSELGTLGDVPVYVRKATPPRLPGYLAVTKMSQKVTVVTFYNFEIRSVH
ncbi:hypothetical protein SCLCIDRAFT_1224312 [Scleroderma citrinum Foug A]|uniref:Uncharacterized protein n=1 Tax=Scleroderma citrinum Foug A TaxID=1036808 RepID=A0A0C3CSR5_9AGAM|nr:hypothetical protein SCLCIDRAFT_1224312 [Scleroderma citrinum Foug A]